MMMGGDSVRAQVNAVPVPRRGEAPLLRRCGVEPCACDQDSAQPIRRDATGAGPTAVPAVVYDVLRSPGQPLDAQARASLEPRLGHDFSRVRVHTDAWAAESADAVGARAYTVGQHIAFAAGSYQPNSAAGRHLLAHELTHVIQQHDATTSALASKLTVGSADDPAEHEADQVADRVMRGGLGARSVMQSVSVPEPRLRRQPGPTDPRTVCFRPGTTLPAPGACWVKNPQNCPTFGAWLSSFSPVKSFPTQDVIPGRGLFTPIGDKPAARDPRDRRATLQGEIAPSTLPATPIPGATAADRFIDHPTDDWVQACLPAELRSTAYMLPADCADVAVILWHVWLFAHGRSATFGPWTCGVGAGNARRRGIGQVIGEVYSQNVPTMLAPYSDARGRPIRRFADLQRLLHPGDVLVWRHSGTGSTAPGHTQTIVDLRYSGDRVTSIDVIQGNMPLGDDPPASQTTAIRSRLQSEHSRQIPSVQELRGAPGRRLELTTLSGIELADGPDPAATAPTRSDVWLMSADTGLVAAGPPKTAARPPGSGRPKTRRLVDWVAPLRSAAGPKALRDAFEAALHEARAMVDAGISDDSGARQIGWAAGEALWRLAAGAHDLADESHFGRLQRMIAVLRSLKDDQPDHPGSTELARVFGLIESALDMAARGMTTVHFPTQAARGRQLVRVLVTGFDPFAPTAMGGRPAPGEWNPSGAAALALDGTQIDLGGNTVAAVEAIVLPVDFSQFEQGLVEAAVGPHLSDVDAVLTVSMVSGELDEGAIRFERFAVGVRDELPGQPGGLKDVPPSRTGSLGRPILESIGPLDILRTQVSGGRLTTSIGDDVTLRFATVAEANAFRQSLGMAPGGIPDVPISDVSALRRIARSATRGSGSAQISFADPSGHSRTATLVDGPGGNFLSNEVSYRVLRLLESLPPGQRPISFHTHVPQGLDLTGSRAAARSQRVRTNVIEALRRTIRVVGGQVIQRRGTGGRRP